MEIFQQEGAQAKVSSIHVNGWFGNFNKMSTCRYLLEEMWGEKDALEYYIYCGDSPNDEPMFAEFSHSVGVDNIRPWLSYMKHHPTFKTNLPGGKGFAEFVDIVLHKRSL